MKFKLLASSLLMAGTLMISGSASAGVVFEWGWNGTLQDWVDHPGILDNTTGNTGLGGSYVSPGLYPGDGDTTFTLDSYTFVLDTTGITLSEVEVDGVDIYDVGISFQTPQSTGSIGYFIHTNDSAGLSLASLDSVEILNNNVTKQIYDSKGGNLLLTLTSINGSSVDFTSFGKRSDIYVVDTLVSGATTDVHNGYTSVPEPMAMALLGIGLAAFGVSRRRAMSETEGLLA